MQVRLVSVINWSGLLKYKAWVTVNKKKNVKILSVSFFFYLNQHGFKANIHKVLTWPFIIWKSYRFLYAVISILCAVIPNFENGSV